MVSVTNNNTKQLHQLFEDSVGKYPSNVALICDNVYLTYQELDIRANQLAQFLVQKNIRPGSVVAILLDRSLDCYVSILALLKTGAVYVPIEVEYPDERINYILTDLPFTAVLTNSTQLRRDKLQLPPTIVIDNQRAEIDACPSTKPDLTPRDSEELCYIIYTSGSTGRPKGVEITHRSICHYATVAGVIYGMTPRDRVFQGFSLAFDASMEEVWMALAYGATLVACMDKDTRSGIGLLDFLQKNKISVFSTVPTLLSSLEGTAKDLRLLILGGEACSANLINRWQRPGLTIMNTYGPTEATVIATYTECEANKEITIGKPLPGYSVTILDENLQPVADGIMGELCIGGMGLAKGYVNRPDLTSVKFIAHPLDPNIRLYRTGDLAYRTANGEIQFAGRIDDQVKLRGFRIELNEIESIIMEYEAIAQAVVSLQTLEQPTLVAYISVNKNDDFDLLHFKAYLRSKLPDYMMPSLFEWLDTFPLLASGKIDRKSLPQPKQLGSVPEYVAPNTEIEEQIAETMQTALNKERISVTADFFYDLGGHSLAAAKVVSNLRAIPAFATLSILDLYQNPSIRQLAAKIELSSSKFKGHEAPKSTIKNKVSDKSYFLCGLGQLFGTLFQYGTAAWQLLIVVLCYTWLGANQSLFSIEAVALYITLFLLMPIATMGLTIVAKWLLLGRVKPGEYPLWGWFYFRWWLVQGLQNNVVQTKYLLGTPIINVFYRLLGARIGANTFIATTHIAVPDLLTVGSDTTISNEARALGYIVEDGWLKIGSITIGDDCFVGARAVLGLNTVMENQAVLDDMSMLPSTMVIGKNQFFAGSPARKTLPPSNHVTVQQQQVNKPTLVQTINYGLLHYFALVLVMMLYYVSFIPSIFILDYFYDHVSFGVLVTVGAPLAATVFLLIHYLNMCLCKKLVMNKPTMGTYSINSLYYLRQSFILKILDNDEIGVLADSIFFPMLLRKLGAKIGNKVEMGEAPQLIPDFLTIENGGFAASGVAFAWPNVYRGYIRYGAVNVGENAFIGNVSLLPIGSKIGKGGLLGCMTIPPANNKAAQADSYWLGSPPMYLPTREIVGGFPDELTYNPSTRLYFTRLVIELIRILLPTTCTLILLCSMFSVLQYLLQNHTMMTTILALPLFECGINLSIVAGLIGLKWLLVGKIKPCIKPLWDIFIWKNDIREFSFGYYINPHLTDLILGTPFVSMLYRAMGAKIGKRVYINTEGFAEFDLITVGDDVCINRDTLIQTHLYEDRIFKLGNLEIKEGCNVGVGSMVLYNTVMEPNSSLGSFSLLMKGEFLPANTWWEGSPAQSSIHAPGKMEPVSISEIESVATLS